eukprot:7019-Heterococcus_DN1.PRE.4
MNTGFVDSASSRVNDCCCYLIYTSRHGEPETRHITRSHVHHSLFSTQLLIAPALCGQLLNQLDHH